ncbi:MAG: molybdenum cofactor biosynthesis protein MoaE [Pyrinomonadaceae bacterium]
MRVLFFGAARDAAGRTDVELVLKDATTASHAFEQLLEKFPGLRRFGRSLLFAVNQEYARADCEVHDGDELAVFPPVSGGSQEATSAEGAKGRGPRRGSRAGVRVSSPERKPGDSTSTGGQAVEEGDRNLANANHLVSSLDFFELTTHPIDIGDVARRVVLPECGATVTLDGYTREWTRDRRTLYLIYEAYEPMALRELERLGREAHERFEIAHIGIVHRTGRLEIGETSVVIAASAPHRRAAFEACEWAIRELKRTVPIWKKEVFEDGEVWVEGEGAPDRLLGPLIT